MATEVDLNKLTVAQLKEECTKLGLPLTGRKPDLIARLVKARGGDEELLDQGGEEAPEGEEEPVDEQILDEEEADKIKEEPVVKEEAADGDEETHESSEANGDAPEGEEDQEDADGDGDEDGDAKTDEPEEKKDTEKQGLSYKKKIDLPDGVPELPSYHQIQEARIAETRMRTVIVYPMNIEDMSNAELQEMLSKAQHFMVKFVLDVEKKKKGFVEMHFNTRKDAREAAGVLRNIELSVGEHTVRQLEPDEAGTAYKSAVIDTIKPHLTHQIKKATDDYDTRVVYVHHLPEGCTEEQLHDIFPEAKAILASIDDEGKNKGFAYLSFETEEESEEVIKKNKELKLDEDRITLHMIRDLKAAAGIEGRRPFRRQPKGKGGMGGKKSMGPREGKSPMRGRGGMQRGRGMNMRSPGYPRGRGMPMPMRGGRGMPHGPMGGHMGGGGVRPLMGGPMGGPRPLMSPQRGGYDGGFRGGRGGPRGGGGGYRNKNPLNSGTNYIDFDQRQARKRKGDFGGGNQNWKMARQGGGGGGYGGNFSGGQGNWNSRW